MERRFSERRINANYLCLIPMGNVNRNEVNFNEQISVFKAPHHEVSTVRLVLVL